MSAILVECHDCALRVRAAPLEKHLVAHCPRCGALLRSHSSQDGCLALAIAGLVLVLLANFMPFMRFELAGRGATASFASGAFALYGEGYWPLTMLILLLTAVMPTLKLGAMAYVLGSLRLSRPPRHVIPLLRWLDEVHPWAMVEVYMLGIFVAYVRMSSQTGATVFIGVAVYALGALMLVMAAMDAVIDYDDLWEEVERKGLVALPQPSAAPLVRCHACGILSAGDAPGARCYRCGATLHRRRSNSIARCWALVLTAAVLYLPANLYPMLTIVSRFRPTATYTIPDGVAELFVGGDYLLFLVVLFASIVVPALKILGLSWLLVMTQRGSRWHLRDRTRIYRIIESVGRWSMIDIFVMSILVALVRLGAVASIIPGKAAVSFAAVVIFTMFASMAFDPRLMWDKAGENR